MITLTIMITKLLFMLDLWLGVTDVKKSKAWKIKKIKNKASLIDEK